MIINFQEPLNVSVQVGDIAWYLPITSNVGVPGNTYNTAKLQLTQYLLLTLLILLCKVFL